MSKTIAPLLSFDAGGQVAKTVVYSRWRGVKYARRYVIPANPQTTAQQNNRAIFATLREMWKLANSDLRAPWDAFATGRQFLGLNAFIGENRRAIGAATDLQSFIASPGALGGIALEDLTISTGAAGGEVDVSFTEPAAPTGWTLDGMEAVAFPDQDPSDRFGGPFTYQSFATGSGGGTISGLATGTDFNVAVWTTWTRPDGRTAYGPSLVGTAASGA